MKHLKIQKILPLGIMAVFFTIVAPSSLAEEGSGAYINPSNYSTRTMQEKIKSVLDNISTNTSNSKASLDNIKTSTNNTSTNTTNTNTKLDTTNTNLDHISNKITETNTFLAAKDRQGIKHAYLKSILELLLKLFQTKPTVDSRQTSLYHDYATISNAVQKEKNKALENIYIDLQYKRPPSTRTSYQTQEQVRMIENRKNEALNNISLLQSNKFTSKDKADNAKKTIDNLLGFFEDQDTPTFQKLEINKNILPHPTGPILAYLNYHKSMMAIQTITANNLLSVYATKLPYAVNADSDTASLSYNNNATSIADALNKMNTRDSSEKKYWVGEDGNGGILNENLFARIHDAITQSFKVGYTLFDIAKQLQEIKLQLAAASAQTTILIQSQYGVNIRKGAQRAYDEAIAKYNTEHHS